MRRIYCHLSMFIFSIAPSIERTVSMRCPDAIYSQGIQKHARKWALVVKLSTLGALSKSTLFTASLGSQEEIPGRSPSARPD